MVNAEAPGSEPRRIPLVVARDEETDSEEVDRLARQLRTELNELDVDSVTILRSGEMPKAAKGEPLTIGALLVSFSAVGGVSRR